MTLPTTIVTIPHEKTALELCARAGQARQDVSMREEAQRLGVRGGDVTAASATVGDKLTRITQLASSGPQLTGTEREEYERICKRVDRANGDLRRAIKRGDAKKQASAERALTNARAMRAEFLAPKVDKLWAPTRIIYKTEGHWHGVSGTGIHRWECEMILDYKDLSGPEYRTVRVLKNEGGPPTNARNAPDCMGVAWFAIADNVKSGRIVVLDGES